MFVVSKRILQLNLKQSNKKSVPDGTNFQLSIHWHVPIETEEVQVFRLSHMTCQQLTITTGSPSCLYMIDMLMLDSFTDASLICRQTVELVSIHFYSTIQMLQRPMRILRTHSLLLISSRYHQSLKLFLPTKHINHSSQEVDGLILTVMKLLKSPIQKEVWLI